MSILDDNVVEDTEFINLGLTSVDNAVMLNPATARINIEDTDSELTNAACNLFQVSLNPLSFTKINVILSLN